MGVPPAGGGDGVGRPAGGGDIHHLPPEHSCTVNFEQSNYGLVSGVGATPGLKGV